MRLLAFAFSASLLIAPAVATAQFAPRQPQRPSGIVYQPSRDPGITREIRSIGREVDEGRAAGQLSRRDERRLERGERLLHRLHHRYARDGLSDSERRELETRAQLLRQEVNRGRLSARGR
jgi:hypothetical protein